VSRRRDLTAGLAFLLLGVGACVGASRLGFGSVRAPEPGFFPWLGGLALVGLSTALVAQAVRRTGTAAGSTGEWARPGLLLGALALYVLVLEPLGYPLATAGLCAVALRILGVRLPVALSVGLGLAVVTFILFRRVLGVELPPGVLALLG
jgi:putative tricarboxylic transport membrane protein